MSLKVYFDLMSQPSRAVMLFCKVNKIPFTPKPIALRKNEHHSEEYGRINPFRKVPAIEDGHFKLTESVAILQYLAEKYKVPDHWYPKDLQERSKVQEYLAWQHMNTRMHCATVFTHEVVIPRVTGSPPDEDALQTLVNNMHTTLTALEEVFLRDKPYLCGDKISIADLLGICEVEQVVGCGRDVTAGRPTLQTWSNRIKTELSPYFDEIHSFIHSLRDRNKKN
ncbi:glutathione S-transferase theta-1-like isoform X2 [Acanthaster planci]|uniref:glutathione transferase n=1 Tax=Acanthaster planci TaxID=133434 RepID=A0A8B7Y1Q8_ACAPL|nr:glutathione S-transferase theta-1-like isoform X2 [Acanthaster planci]